MLEQYRQDYSQENDALSDSRFQMSRRKLVFTMAAAALALVAFLFVIGAFRSEETAQVANAENTEALIAKVDDLQARVEKLEKQSPQVATADATRTALATMLDSPILEPTAENTQAIDQTLKELIANEPMMQESQQAAPIPSEPVAPPVVAAPKAAAPRTYVVQRGDTLSKISLRVYGTTKRWKEIADANKDKISNINQLKVGTKLTIPEGK